MRHASYLLIAVIILASASTSSAQRQFGGGAGSMPMGGGGMNGMSMGGSGFGGMSSMMGSGGGMSGLSGMGGMGSGFGSGFGSGMGMGMGSGMGMSGFGNSSLGGTGMGMNGQQGFIGRDTSDMESIFNQLGRNSNQFMQQLNRTMSRGNRGRRNASQEENMVLPVRVRLDVAFDRPAIQPTMAATKVRGRLEKMLVRRNIAAPGVEVAGDTVVLTGVAANESQRLVIEKLVLLEPGVMSVDNRMTLAEQALAAPSPPVASPQSPPLPPQADN